MIWNSLVFTKFEIEFKESNNEKIKMGPYWVW